MNRRRRTTVLTLTILALCLLSVVSYLVPLSGIRAAEKVQTACVGGGTVVLTDIEPDSITNTSATVITVIGEGFEDGAIVVVQGYSSLQTTFVNSTMLTAEVPAGIPGDTAGGRSYDILVYNPSDPETNCAVLERGLTVWAPAATATLEPTDTPKPTRTPVPTGTPVPTDFVRPAITVQSYGASSEVLSPGQNVDFEITLQNTGQITATNVAVTFVSGDLIPRATGGVQTINSLSPGESYRFFQPLRVDSTLSAYDAILMVEASYTDQYGTPYTDSFDLVFPVYQAASTATPTPTLSVRPDIVIEGYETEPEWLSAGDTLKLNLDLVNASPIEARQIIVSLNLSTTSLDVLAPLTTGNERYIDHLDAGDRTSVSYNLAVSGNAEAGLVPVDFELSYIDNNNVQYTDAETLSLRIDTVPHLYIGLYEDLPEVINVGDSLTLSIQIINIGENTLNLNTVEITSDQLDITDGSTYLGSLDGGTSGSVVATAQVLESGTATALVQVNYLDDFQQPQLYTQELTFEVAEQEQPEAGGAAGQAGPQPGAVQEMTIGQRIKQALLGFFGLAVQSGGGGAMPGMMPGQS